MVEIVKIFTNLHNSQNVNNYVNNVNNFVNYFVDICMDYNRGSE